MPPLDIVAGGPLAIGDDVDHLRDKARPMLALYFGGMGAKGANFYNDVLRGYGFEQIADDIQDAYLGGDKKAAAAMIPQELVDGMSLIGDEGFVRDRIAAYKAAGVTVLNVAPVGPNGLPRHRDPRRLDLTRRAPGPDPLARAIAKPRARGSGPGARQVSNGTDGQRGCACARGVRAVRGPGSPRRAFRCGTRSSRDCRSPS